MVDLDAKSFVIYSHSLFTDTDSASKIPEYVHMDEQFVKLYDSIAEKKHCGHHRAARSASVI